MAKGCLLPIAICAWIVGLILFIAFGPRSLVLGEMFGIGYVSLTVAFFRRYPFLQEAVARGQAERRFQRTGQRERAENEPGSLAAKIENLVGWGLTALIGSFALLMSAIALGVWYKGARDSELTGAATLSGITIAITYYFWKNIPHLGRVK